MTCTISSQPEHPLRTTPATAGSTAATHPLTLLADIGTCDSGADDTPSVAQPYTGAAGVSPCVKQRLATKRAAAELVASARPWPFTTDDAPPLAWWRILPADHFRDAEHLLVRATLDGLTVINGDRRWREALRGDAVAAAGIAIALMPVEAITLRIDIAMTAVLRAALDDDPVASLLLTHFLSHAQLDHPFGAELAQSWRDHDRRFADRYYAREAAKTAASASTVVGVCPNAAAGNQRADKQAKRSLALNLSAADGPAEYPNAGEMYAGGFPMGDMS